MFFTGDAYCFPPHKCLCALFRTHIRRHPNIYAHKHTCTRHTCTRHTCLHRHTLHLFGGGHSGPWLFLQALQSRTPSNCHFSAGSTCKSLQVRTRFWLSRKGMSARERHSSLEKERQRLYAGIFEPVDARLFLSILEVPGYWKTIGGSQLPDFLSPPCLPNNLMLEAFKDPDIRITRVTSLNG